MASGRHGLPAPYEGGEGASRFFRRFECACIINKWETDADKAMHVLPLFGDAVFDFAATLKEADRRSYTKLKAEIIKQFDSAILTNSVAEQFSDRRKKDGESLTELMMALKVLAEKAYSELPIETQERLVRDQFIKSLPGEVRKHVLLQPNLESSDDLLKEALRAEEVYGASTPKATVAAIASPLESIEKTLATLTEKFSELEANQKTVARVQHPQRDDRNTFRRPSHFRGTCFRCNQQGHMARDCTRRNARVCEHCRNPGHTKENCAIRDKQISDF